MKKLTYRFCSFRLVYGVALIAILFFMACEKDENIDYTDPSIKIVNGDGYVSVDSTIGVGQSFTVAVHAEWNGQHHLMNLIARLNGDDYMSLGVFKETYDHEIEITKGFDDIEEWEFIIRDYAGNSASTNLTITKDPNIRYGEIDEFLNIQLGAQNSTEYGSFFSFSNGLIYDLESAYRYQQLINMAYVYDNYDAFEESIITSPGGNLDDAYTSEFGVVNWETRNTIRYARDKSNITVEEFNAAANDSILIANTFSYTNGGRKTKYLATDDIYVFVTDDNRTGIFKVISTSGTDNGYIIIDIKLEK